MAEINEYAPGTFCWVDLATTNLPAAKSFYRALFGWLIDDLPDGEPGAYCMARKGERTVAGLYQGAPEPHAIGSMPVWLSYVCVMNADVEVRRARHLGAELLVAPFTVLDKGRAALLRDPTGARFALWEPLAYHGAEIVEEPGTLCWNELFTSDLDRAGAFYSQLYGWESRVEGRGTQRRTVFSREGVALAGLRSAELALGAASAVPPEWRVFFSVTDCDASCVRAKELGATLLTPPADVPFWGRVASLRDPQGAVFSVMRRGRTQDS